MSLPNITQISDFCYTWKMKAKFFTTLRSCMEKSKQKVRVEGIFNSHNDVPSRTKWTCFPLLKTNSKVKKSLFFYSLSLRWKIWRWDLNYLIKKKNIRSTSKKQFEILDSNFKMHNLVTQIHVLIYCNFNINNNDILF